MNLLYFTNIIPPIPLALKQTGVYHRIVRVIDNSAMSAVYEVKAEATTWQDYFNRYPVFHKGVGESVYVFNAIFSPGNFVTEIVHQWQYFDETNNEWVDSSKIILPISGGREEGFRTYSFKKSVSDGLWRVKVMTVSGQVLGLINFRVENVFSSPNLITETL